MFHPFFFPQTLKQANTLSEMATQFFLKLITLYLWVDSVFCIHVIVAQIICIFTLGFVYATLTILMIFFSNVGQIIKDAHSNTHNTVLPAYYIYPNPDKN